MSVLDTAKYYFFVNGLGKAALRYERLKLERKLRNPSTWTHEHLSAPVGTSPWLKELISRHYLKGQYANLHGKVAWVTSGAPVEFLSALGYFLIYPENHAAVCGIRRKAEDLCIVAEEKGYSRDICSYARTDFGSVISGETPVGRLPKPDLLLCCTNICQTVLFWYRVLADHFRVPLIVIDTPFVYDQPREHALRFITEQIEHGVTVAEEVAGKSLDWGKLQLITERSKEAVDLWAEILATCKNRPAPITAFDEFIHMAPIVEMRGEQFTVEYFRALLDELEERVKKGIGAIKNEKKRLIWDNLPIWHRIRWMSEWLAERGVALVASTYTNAWGELGEKIDTNRPLESAAEVYIHPILNRGTAEKLQVMKNMVTEFHADGVILHSDRSCKPYSIGQIDQRDELANSIGVPALLLEADHNDPRTFSEEQVDNRLAAFCEVLESQ